MRKPRLITVLRAIALSSVLTLSLPSQAQAAPVVGAVAAFAATPLGGALVSLAGSVVVSFGASLLRQLTGGANKPKANLAMRLAVAVGGVVAQSFLVGDWATAGSLNYRGSFGSDGGTPNAFYVEERVLSDVPMPELTGFIYGEQRGTLLRDQPHPQYGWPVAEARRGGKDHLWVKYRDGSQTTADPYLRAKFGDHPTRPYLATMIGRGRAVAIVTRLVPGEDDRDLFPANLEYKFESSGIALYDISKDSTAGGSGPHRWADQSTWEPSGNTAVQIYNLWRGIRYRPYDEWIFGLQSLHFSQLPGSVWIAAINEANVAKDRVGTTSEPQFRTGAEILVDQELVAVTEQLLGGASGRMAEIGGVYKILLGAPGAAVYTHTDRNIVVTAEQGYEPFPRIENTKNGVRPKFVSVANGWELKDAPARYSSAFEIEDGGRRLPADVTFSTVTSPTRVQRLSKTIAEEQRGWRKHRYGLPPEASELEPLDVLSWTSAENGYSAKKFLITEVDDEPTYLPVVATQELDPDDYDYDAGAEEKPVAAGHLGIVRPPAQVATAWDVEGVVIRDQFGADRRPGVRFTWNGLIEDVRSVAFEAQIRSGPNAGAKVLTESTDLVSAGAIEYAGGRLLPGLQCEGRIKYLPRGPRATQWTGWLPFDLPDLRFTANDIFPGAINLTLLDQMVRDGVNAMLGSGPGSLAAQVEALENQIEEVAAAAARNATVGLSQRTTQRREYVAQVEGLRDALTGELQVIRSRFSEQIDLIATNVMTLGQQLTLLTSQFNTNTANVAMQLLTQANAISAQASWLTDVAAQAGDATAGGRIKWQAVAGPDSSIKLELVGRVTNAAGYGQVGMIMQVYPDLTSEIVQFADRWMVSNGSLTAQPLRFEGSVLYTQDMRVMRITSPDGYSMVIDATVPEIEFIGP